MAWLVPGFVVAAEEGDAVRVLDLEAQQVLESLDRVVASVNEIADEDIARAFDLSA